MNGLVVKEVSVRVEATCAVGFLNQLIHIPASSSGYARTGEVWPVNIDRGVMDQCNSYRRCARRMQDIEHNNDRGE